MTKIITKLFLLMACTYISNTFSEEVNYLIVEGKSPPFQITHEGKSNGGIITDIVKEVFNGSPYTVKYHVLPLNRLYKIVESGQLDNWIAYDAKAWNSLSQWGDFVSEPLFSVNHTYLTCKKNPPAQIKSVSELSHQNIAIIRDFIHPELNELEDSHLLNLVPVENYSQGINLAALNRVDGFVEMELRIRFNIKNELTNNSCFQFVYMGDIIPTYSIYFSTDKRNTDINTFVNKRIKALKKANEIDKIMSRYTQTGANRLATKKTAP
ncbi:substrate-binding periplasmic protein [Alkalimarinus alittae]|uniref:Transporter substrate-binding domain-containing protein n=1 Tax=Alkalimarinus alittae TaxID=2961619 RepID=A0ABY6N3B3_9ALTE|nr:transporter substrate-binding domain-containing protein [Alkalimarinus alittae]UZE96611.1 transporter substrate-binding domain-containing protein [Alkalimarinus alittae]